MRILRNSCSIVVVWGFLISLLAASPIEVPSSFKLIGGFKLTSSVKIENGEVLELVISPLDYEVYSDGLDVRVYCITEGGSSSSYTNYSIYRSDGISSAKNNEIIFEAGVQAYSTQGDMIRQISLTRKRLTMIKIPPQSSRIIVTRAERVSN